jgi:hypothetical protein
VAWTLTKSARLVSLVLRQHPVGTELRCIYQGDVLWTELLKHGPGHQDAVQTAVADARVAWEAKGWRE